MTSRIWYWLLAGYLLLMVGSVGAGLVSVRDVGHSEPSNITLANAASILPGMSEAEVDAILGPPSEVKRIPPEPAVTEALERWPEAKRKHLEEWDFTDKYWDGPDLTITVFFHRGRVSDAQADRHPRATSSDGAMTFASRPRRRLR